MDTLSHGLHGGIAFGRGGWRKYAAAFFFGVLPDIFSFGPYIVLSFLGVLPMVRSAEGYPEPSLIPAFVYTMYDITHSFVIYAAFCALLVTLGKRSFIWLTLGWPLHILVDMPTHSQQFFPTPFLWPLSDVTIDGMPWSTPGIFIPNVIIIVVLYGWWYWSSKCRRRA